jgi:hypothetical protein
MRCVSREVFHGVSICRSYNFIAGEHVCVDKHIEYPKAKCTRKIVFKGKKVCSCMKYYKPAEACTNYTIRRGRKFCMKRSVFFDRKGTQVICAKTGKVISTTYKVTGTAVPVKVNKKKCGCMIRRVKRSKSEKKLRCSRCAAMKKWQAKHDRAMGINVRVHYRHLPSGPRPHKLERKIHPRLYIVERRSGGPPRPNHVNMNKRAAPVSRCAKSGGRKLCRQVVYNTPQTVTEMTMDKKGNTTRKVTTHKVHHHHRVTYTKTHSHKVYHHRRYHATHSVSHIEIPTIYKTVLAQELSSVENYTQTIKVNLNKFSAVDQTLINKCAKFF